MRIAYLVAYTYYDDHEVDSVWRNRKKAERRVEKLNKAVRRVRNRAWYVREIEFGESSEEQ